MIELNQVQVEARVSSISGVLDLIKQALPAAERDRAIDTEDSLVDLGVGSLALLTLVLDLEEQFGLPPSALKQLTSRSTIGTLIRICQQADAVRRAEAPAALQVA
jgi:acyl carrier protein